MKKLLLMMTLVFSCQFLSADPIQCLTKDQADLVAETLKKTPYIIRLNYSGEVELYELIKIKTTDVLACGDGYADPGDIHSVRITGIRLATWIAPEDRGCPTGTGATLTNDEIDDVLIFNYVWCIQKDLPGRFSLMINLWTTYDNNCQAFSIPDAEANGITDAGYKKLSKKK